MRYLPLVALLSIVTVAAGAAPPGHASKSHLSVQSAPTRKPPGGAALRPAPALSSHGLRKRADGLELLAGPAHAAAVGSRVEVEVGGRGLVSVETAGAKISSYGHPATVAQIAQGMKISAAGQMRGRLFVAREIKIGRVMVPIARGEDMKARLEFLRRMRAAGTGVSGRR
jgi:hypothetical protein